MIHECLHFAGRIEQRSLDRFRIEHSRFGFATSAGA
jgi:hypothetical protein